MHKLRGSNPYENSKSLDRCITANMEPESANPAASTAAEAKAPTPVNWEPRRANLPAREQPPPPKTLRELKVEGELLFLDQVKIEFQKQPHVNNESLDIMKNFKSQSINVPGVMDRVKTLFRGNNKVILGFNTFLPDGGEGYKIELTPEEEICSVADLQVPKTASTSSTSTGLHHANLVAHGTVGDSMTSSTAKAAFNVGGSVAGGENKEIVTLPAATTAPVTANPPAVGVLADPHAIAALGQAGQPEGQEQGNCQLQQAHAIHYVTKIPNRFSIEPGSFLKILHTYQKEQNGIKGVLEQVPSLFANHPDLLTEVTYFLLDAEGFKHRKNEILLDVSEKLHSLVSSSIDTVLHSEIMVSNQTKNILSSMPAFKHFAETKECLMRALFGLPSTTKKDVDSLIKVKFDGIDYLIVSELRVLIEQFLWALRNMQSKRCEASSGVQQQTSCGVNERHFEHNLEQDCPMSRHHDCDHHHDPSSLKMTWMGRVVRRQLMGCFLLLLSFSSLLGGVSSFKVHKTFARRLAPSFQGMSPSRLLAARKWISLIPEDGVAPRIFSIKLDDSIEIVDDLKEAIKKKKANDLRDVDADSLVLEYPSGTVLAPNSLSIKDVGGDTEERPIFARLSQPADAIL